MTRLSRHAVDDRAMRCGGTGHGGCNLRDPLAMVKPITPRAILVLGWVAFLLFAYPGQLTQDSLDQLREARAGFYTDSHPPVMQLLWSVVDHVIAGPFGMLLLQSSTFLAGAYLILRRSLSPRRSAVVAIGVLLFPPVMTVMAVVWKDCLMAGFLLLGIALMLEPRRPVRIAGLVLVGFGAAMRYNGLAAALPVIVLLFEWRAGTPRFARYASALVVWMAVTAAVLGTNAALTDRRMHYWHSTNAVMDIAGTVRYAGPTSDDELGRELAGTELLVDHDLYEAISLAYSPRSFRGLVSPPTAIWNLPFGANDPPPPVAQREAIARAWWHLITRHPVAYLTHRARVFLQVLGVSAADTWGPVLARRPRTNEQFHELGLPVGASAVQDAWTAAVSWLVRYTPLYSQWLYLLIAIAMLRVCRRQRHLVVLLLSGLALEASLFFLAPSPDYRYSHWMIACTCLAVSAASSGAAQRARTLAEPTRHTTSRTTTRPSTVKAALA